MVLSATPTRSKFVQYGIVSAGIFECGKIAGYPDIFTRITYYIQWILDNVKD